MLILLCITCRIILNSCVWIARNFKHRAVSTLINNYFVLLHLQKSTTISEDESTPRSFSPSSMDNNTSIALNRGDVGDGVVNQIRTNWDGLNLNMTAAEMRARIGSKKKRDPRKEDRLDFKRKYEIIQTL